MTGMNWVQGMLSKFRLGSLWFLTKSSLPLTHDYGAGLAILAKTYFDILYGKNEQAPDQVPTEEQKAQSKDECSTYFHYVESFPGNLSLAFRLWDAVSHSK